MTAAEVLGDGMSFVLATAVLAVGLRAANGWCRRSRIRITVRHLDSAAGRDARHERAVQGLDAGCRRLLAAIPQQRGGEQR